MEATSGSQSTTSRPSRRLRAIGLRGGLSAALALGAGLSLRIWMLKKFFEVGGDSLIYGGLAKNLLLRGQYALTTGTGVTYSTLIRLPGYPLFLALCFRLFGMENYFAAAGVQIVLDVAGCLLLAGFVRRIASPRAALCTLWLAALCPFTAIYAVAPLTEAPTLFLLALALWSLVRFHVAPGWLSALPFTFALTYSALLRPDGALVAVALAPALLIRLKWFRGSADERSSRARAPNLLRMALVCGLLALAPFAVWTARNWRVFHVFEPLAPRYATDPGEETFPGWQRWVKTWSLDFVSTYEVYWPVPGSTLDLSKLPSRAFDSPAQYAETAALAADYNDAQDLNPDLDARFARLAGERIAAHPLRYFAILPLGRMADMWLRPRVENLPIDLDWWEYSHHYTETRFSWFYAALNAGYLLLAIAGLCMRPRYWPWMLAYFLMRSALLMTIEAPEARYTLECFPMVFALAGIGLDGGLRKLLNFPGRVP